CSWSMSGASFHQFHRTTTHSSTSPAASTSASRRRCSPPVSPAQAAVAISRRRSHRAITSRTCPSSSSSPCTGATVPLRDAGPVMMAAVIRYGTAEGRWLIIAAVLGSGVVFLDGTVVNVALPVLGRDLHASLRGLQWILDGYLVTLSSLLLLGGSAGDRYGRRRIFVAGLAGFTVASVLCGL